VIKKKYSNTKIAISQEYVKIFAASFANFFKDKTLRKRVTSSCIYFTYTKMMPAQTSRMNFVTEQNVDFIKLTRVASITFVVTSL